MTIMILILISFDHSITLEIKYRDEPQNVTSELGGMANFSCMRERDSEGNGSRSAPHWKIKFSNGTTMYSFRDNLPFNHVLTATGLSVTIEDIELNFTAYTCYYLILVPDGRNNRPLRVYSNTGYLTINFPYTAFSLSPLESSKTYFRVGENISFIVIKRGGGNFSFNVTVNTSSK